MTTTTGHKVAMTFSQTYVSCHKLRQNLASKKPSKFDIIKKHAYIIQPMESKSKCFGADFAKQNPEILNYSKLTTLTAV